MSYVISNRFKTLSVAMLLLGAVTAGYAYSTRLVQQRRHGAVAFTLTSRQTATPADGTPAGTITEVRYQKSDGTWKQVRTYFGPDGKMLKEDIAFGQVGRGVFHVDEENKALQFLSQMEAVPVNRAGYDRHKDEKFVREEMVLGYRTEVLRFAKNDGSSYMEEYYAPALGGLAIKTVTVNSRGTSVKEPVQIQLGEPPESEFIVLPGWPVRYDFYQDKIRTAEERGEHETVKQMREVLQRERERNPHE